MKNDEQMYQSVLSRRDAYRAKKEQRIRTVRRTVPVLACCCLAAVLGIGYRKYLKKLPTVPVVPESSDIAVTESPVTTASADTAPARSDTVTDAVQTGQPQVTASQATQTVTAAVTVTVQRETEQTAAPLTEPQKTVTAASVTQTRTAAQTQPMTQTQPVTKPPVITTEEPGAPEPPARTTEPYQPPQSPSKEEPSAAQAQPLMYPDIQAAAADVKAGDLSAYELRDKYQYRAMFDRMLIDGFLYQVSNANGITRQETQGITLLPDADYEDSGVSCRVQYQGQSYYVAFHYADYKYMTMPDYLRKRMKCASDRDVTVNGETVCLRFADDGQITANAFAERDRDSKWNPDSEVYYTVRASVSETEMLDFLNAMQYEKIPLHDFLIL